MDHRCLYGHRVPAAFTFAIQSRTCPTCGAPTVTVNGYQAARKLTTEAGLDAVAAFHAVRVIEAEWVLQPAAPPVAGASAPATTPAEPPTLAAEPAAAQPAEEEEVVIEDVADPATAPPPTPAPAVVATPEPRITARPKPDKIRVEPAIVDAPSAAPPPVVAGPGFGKEEEDFFKGA